MDIIDCFSVGSLPYQLYRETQGGVPNASVGISDTLPILSTAVFDGRLTADDIVKRLYTNPKKIFDLHDQPESSVQVEVREYVLEPKDVWSPFVGKRVHGLVKRVNFNGQTVSLDGKLSSDGKLGTDMSAHLPAPPAKAAASYDAVRPAPAITATRALQPIESIKSPKLGPVSFGRELQATSKISPTLVQLLQNPAYKKKHILSVDQLSRQDLHLLFNVASELRLAVERYGSIDLLNHRVLCTMFYEPSTRTSASFDAAMQRLGGKVVAVDATHSSIVKGEILEDTIRTLACYGDAVVLRHPDENSAPIAAKYSPVPVINAGLYTHISLSSFVLIFS
jgi:carbamoyl-phosphate synthase / aspartate carbamoyltransferase